MDVKLLLTTLLVVVSPPGMAASAATTVETRDTAPVTGTPMGDFAIGAAALILPGILLLLVVIRRPRRTDRDPDTLS